MATTKVLLVENRPEDVNLITQTLATAGPEGMRFDLAQADTLSGALKFLACEECDVVLLELELPDSGGIETFLKIGWSV